MLLEKISILIAVSKYPSNGGRNTIITKISKNLRNLGFEITIGAFDLPSELSNDPHFLKLSKSQFFHKKIDSHNFDLIHTHETLMNYFFFFSKTAILFHYHGVNGKLQSLNLKLLSVIGRNKINSVVSVSDSAKSYLEKINCKIPIHIISNGVDTEIYAPNLERPYVKGYPQLLFVGSILPHKNLIFLISSMKKILEFFPKTHLQIVGNGPIKSKLQDVVKENNLEKQIEFIENLSENELKLRYSSCDIYVSASLLETFDLPILEAMSCGKPFLASSIPAHKELLNKSRAGLTFSVHDSNNFVKKLETILTNKTTLSENARNFAKTNDWKIICVQIARLYKTILKK